MSSFWAYHLTPTITPILILAILRTPRDFNSNDALYSILKEKQHIDTPWTVEFCHSLSHLLSKSELAGNIGIPVDLL